MLNDFVLLNQYQRFTVTANIKCSITTALSDPIPEGPPQEVCSGGEARDYLSKQRLIIEPAKGH